jgi:ankyrin repeat protein
MAQNHDKQTSLHVASSQGQEKLLAFLCADAPVQPEDKDGNTPLKKGQVDVARMVIECGADVVAQNNDGHTPLHLASI